MQLTENDLSYLIELASADHWKVKKQLQENLGNPYYGIGYNATKQNELDQICALINKLQNERIEVISNGNN